MKQKKSNITFHTESDILKQAWGYEELCLITNTKTNSKNGSKNPAMKMKPQLV